MSRQSKETTGSRPLSGSVEEYIEHSRKKITIIFTDIEDSTKYWETHGDVQGRLMVDLHNRLCFPVIKRFKGKIIKTIGDSIMASFKKPENAVKAAMGMQQILQQAREADASFALRIRIGVHTGLALVEKHDVFGDVVNTAARVESEADGNQILLSEATKKAVKDYDFGVKRAGRFKPKGKSAMMNVYEVQWEDFESLVKGIKPGSYMPVVAKQKAALAAYAVAAVITTYVMFLRYFRYLAADFKDVAVLTLNPGLIVDEYPAAIIAPIVVIAIFGVLLWRVQAASHFVLRTMSGSLGFAIGFFLFLIPSLYLPFSLIPTSDNVLYQSKHLFVEVLEDDSTIRTEPVEDAELIRTVDAGAIMLQMNHARRNGISWNQVYLGPEEKGWIMRISPPKMGVAETRVTEADKFYFRHRDLYALVLGLVGFFWGFRSFRIKPT